MEVYQKRNDSKGMFATVTNLTKQACPTVKLVRDKQGHILTVDSEILQRWGEYCDNLYSERWTRDSEDGSGSGTRPLAGRGGKGYQRDETRKGGGNPMRFQLNCSSSVKEW